MVNPQIQQENASNTKKGISKQLLCAPFALALTAAIPMGAAYADEAPSVPQESSSSAVESVQDSSDSSSSSTDSSQGSEAEDSGSSGGETDLTESDSPASVEESSGVESSSTTTAPVTAPASGSGSSSSSSSVTLDDPDIDVDAASTSGSSDSAQADATDVDVDANAGAQTDVDAALPEEESTEADVTAAAGDRTEVTISGEYKQSEARKLLDLVNADRATTNGSHALTWDYALEQYAMQRAAEIAYNFSHTRPNGDPFSKEIMTYGYYSVGENIHKATYRSSYSSANQAWIDSTGHHINRTKEKWQGYAAACFYLANTAYGPMWCWVELFSTPNGNPNYKAPADGNKTVTVVLKGDNYQIIENSTDDGSNPYSLGWWYDEKKDKFTYVRALTYTSYVPMYQTDITVMIDGKEYTFTSDGFITKESEKNLPFTREQYLGLVASQPGQDPTQPPQSSNGTNNGSSTNPDARPVINTKSSRSTESQTRTTPGAVRDEYGYTLYLTRELMNSGARWETQGNRTVFRLADGSLATGWIADGNQRYYLDPNGEMAKGWRRINGAWYFFDSVNGIMKTGLFEFGGDRYYTNEKGAMQTGMVEIDGQRYFAEASGILHPSQEAR